MEFAIGFDKQKTDDMLPIEQRVYITLETQEEINKLYALLNHRLVAKAIHTHSGAWEKLKLILPKNNGYEIWYSKLCKAPIGKD